MRQCYVGRVTMSIRRKHKVGMMLGFVKCGNHFDAISASREPLRDPSVG
jgi:hypothetical protein